MITATGDDRDGRKAPPGVTAPGETDEEAELKNVFELKTKDEEVDTRVHALARQIMERLAVPKPRIDVGAHRGDGRLKSVPYNYASDEIDLDRTLEVLTERPLPDDEDILVRERLRTKRSVVLLVDVSGSMKGERITTAAATVGALAAELSHDSLAVIAFWSDAVVLLNLGDRIEPFKLLDTILRVPTKGLTNVAFPLEVALEQLKNVPASHSRVVLLSDCVHNAGPDPRPIAAKLPRVDVLLDASGEKDVDLGRELARRGKGICKVINNYRDVAPAISRMFGD